MLHGWWVTELWEAHPVLLISWVVWVIASITLHELAHGWAAIRCGDDTPIVTGHMTWNPLVHMGGPSLIMFALVGIAWGLMPVNPSRFRGRYDDAIVSFAGPAMNLSLAVTAFLAAGLWTAIAGGYWFAGAQVSDPLFTNVALFLRMGIILNLVLFVLNLAPVPPLDGSRILAAFSPAARRLYEHEHAPFIALGAFVLLFYFGGPVIFGAATEAVVAAQDAFAGALTGRT